VSSRKPRFSSLDIPPQLSASQAVAYETATAYAGADSKHLPGSGADRTADQATDNRAADGSRDAAEFGITIRDGLRRRPGLAGGDGKASRQYDICPAYAHLSLPINCPLSPIEIGGRAIVRPPRKYRLIISLKFRLSFRSNGSIIPENKRKFCGNAKTSCRFLSSYCAAWRVFSKIVQLYLRHGNLRDHRLPMQIGVPAMCMIPLVES
jgi:hypothetical protein